eukprot:g14126.t2
MVAKDAGSSAMLRRSATTTRRAQSFLVVPVYFACATRVGASLFGPWFRNKGVREQLADLEEQTWLLILGNSVFRGLYLTLVDMILRQDQKGDLRSSALQKCWGYADFQVGNLRVTYQDMRLYEFTTVEDSVVCDDDKLSATSSAAFIASCDQFLRSTVFGNDTAGWPKVVVAPSHLVDSDESPNLAIEVVMEALPAAWKGELLFIDHMAGLHKTSSKIGIPQAEHQEFIREGALLETGQPNHDGFARRQSHSANFERPSRSGGRRGKDNSNGVHA